MFLRCLLIGLLLLGLAPTVDAQEPGCHRSFAIWWQSLWQGVPFCKQPCPDDYCPKQPPPVPPVPPCTGVDDYCAKPPPPVPPIPPCTGIDDYCPKPPPKVEPLCCYPPWYTCGVTGCPK
jgi:hypothetical protein